MSFSSHKKLAASFGAVLLLTVAIGVTSYQSTIRMKREADELKHAEEVLSAANRLVVTVQEDQIGTRGYVLTGDERFLEPHLHAKIHYGPLFDRLRRMTANEPVQQEKLATLKPLLDQRLELSDHTIELKKTRGQKEASMEIRTGNGSALSAQIKSLTEQIQQEERNRLDGNKLRAASAARRTRAGIVAGGLLAIGVLSSAFWMVQRDLRRRKRAENELRRSHELLEQRVEQRTADLLQANNRVQREAADHQRAALALKESEERFRQVIENIEEVFWITDTGKSTMHFISAGYEKIWGRTCEMLYQFPTSWLDAIHPDDRPRILEATSRQCRNGYDEEYRIIRPEGSIRWVHDRAFPIRNAEGEIYRIAGVAADITARKVSEEALRENQARLHEADRRLATIVQSMTEACFAVDSDWHFTFANDRCETLCHIPRERMIGKSLWDAFSKLQGTWMEKEMRRAMNQRVPVSFETFSPITLCWVEARFFPIADGLAAFIMDIEQRKHAENALLDSERRLAGVVGSAMDAIISIDEQQRIVLFNTAAEEMFGCTAAEAAGTEIERFIPVQFQDLRRFEIKPTHRIPGTVGALNAVRTDGEKFPIEASISDVEIGGRRFCTVIIRDVTERLRSERALTIRNRQQEALADIGQHALEGRDLDQLFDEAVSLIRQILDVDFCELLELLPDGESLLLRAGAGWKPGVVRNSALTLGLESHAGYTLQANAPVLVEDFTREPRFQSPTLLREHGAVSGLSVTIAGRGRPYGVLGVHSKRPRIHSIVDVHFVQSVATMFAAAIERHELEQELMHISDEEQRRIGRDLHDGLCQHLAGLEFRTEALTRELVGNPDVQAEVAKIGALIRSGTKQARMLSRGLTPVEVEANGLMSALDELAAHSSLLFSCEVAFHCDEPVLLANHSVATHLYRITQEAISNAVRHAQASLIEINLRQEEENAVLTVTNDGAPLPAEPVRQGGMGLRIMRYRAEMIGGLLQINSTKEGRTAVICTCRIDR